MSNNKILLSVLSLFFCFGLFSAAQAENFDPNYIISDQEILNYNAMSYQSIVNFLKSKNSYLSTYYHNNPEGQRMSAAEIIYDRSQENKISPQFLLVLLQKEQSLVEGSTPRQSQLDWATGYGCPDGASCNTRWKGFWKQVNSAGLQFIDYIENPHLYTYKAGNTYTFTNPYSTLNQKTNVVTPQNKATAALYNYTPHVYNGNYNFHKIWQRWFTRTYPSGTLVQAEGEIGVWLIKNGQKLPFLTKGALTTRFDLNKIVTVKKAELDKYPKGNPIKFPQYSLIRSPGGSIYLLVDDKRRGIVNGEAFRKIGFNPEEIINASWDDIQAYEEGLPITEDSAYPTGALLQDNKTGGVYYVTEGTKAPLLDAIFLKTKFRNQAIVQVDPEKLNSYATVDAYKYPDGELLTPSDSRAVYVISEGKKRLIISGKAFEGLGYKWDNIIIVPRRVADLYENGENLNLTIIPKEEDSASATDAVSEDNTEGTEK